MFAQMYMRTEDGTMIDPDDRIIAFSIERFVCDICADGCCFICGALPGSKDFNDEHVIPKWLLRRHHLFDDEITLPNGSNVRYGRYTLPCCVDCNSALGREIEVPVSEIISGGYDAVAEHLRQEGPALLFRWMALVYLKTHLRDTTQRWHRDPRKGTHVIGDIYDWETLHHVHCIARTALTGVGLGRGAIGTLTVLPALALPGEGAFDYGDLYLARTFFLRSGDLAVLAVLNDAGAGLIARRNLLGALTGPLITPQLREVLANFAFVNLHLKERPRFATMPTGKGFEIQAELPAIVDIDLEARPTAGEMTAQLSSSFIRGSTPEEHQQILDEFQRGERSFLFDAEGNFVDYRERGAGGT
jgi:hypothetical protein